MADLFDEFGVTPQNGKAGAGDLFDELGVAPPNGGFDTPWQAIKKSVTSTPERFGVRAAGLRLNLAESAADHALGPVTGTVSPEDKAADVAQVGIADSNTLRWLNRQRQEFSDREARDAAIRDLVDRDSGPMLQAVGIKKSAPQQLREARAALAKTAPNLPPDASKLTQFGVDAAGSVADMIPSIAVGTVAGPIPGLYAMGAQISGDDYVQARDTGRLPAEARQDTAAASAFETIPETIPFLAFLKHGSPLLHRVLEGTVGEGASEMLTEALRAAYEKGVLDKSMTLKAALQRIGYAGLLGAATGGALAVGVHPFVSAHDEHPTDQTTPTEPAPPLGLPPPSVNGYAVNPAGEARPVYAGEAAAMDAARKGRADIGLTPDVVAAQQRSASPAGNLPAAEPASTETAAPTPAPAGDLFDELGAVAPAAIYKESPAPTSAPAPAEQNQDLSTIPDGIDANIHNVATTPSAIDAAAHDAATSPINDLPQPTDAQKEAGNYQKGHVRINGLDISIENPAGSQRNPEWPPLANHYGYIRGTIGKDKDHIDVFIGPRAEDPAAPVFVVDQIDPKTQRFDEHKVVMGASNEQEARDIYQANYSKDWNGLGAIKKYSLTQFKSWVRAGRKTRPVSYKQPTSVPMQEQTQPEQSAPQAIDFESFAAQRGASRQNIGDAGLHRKVGVPDSTWQRNMQLQSKKDAALVARREQLRQEYDRLVNAGKIRPPTNTEKLVATARGHNDNESVQAARRALTARGIDWKSGNKLSSATTAPRDESAQPAMAAVEPKAKTEQKSEEQKLITPAEAQKAPAAAKPDTSAADAAKASVESTKAVADAVKEVTGAVKELKAEVAALRNKPTETAPKAAETIQDAGAKIGGARKDTWKDRGLRLADLEGMTGGEEAQHVTKDHVWPKPDYAKLIAGGMEPKAAAMLKVMRDRIAAKPREDTPEGRRTYLKTLSIVMDHANGIKTERDAEALAGKVKSELGIQSGATQYSGADARAGFKKLFSIYKGRTNPLSMRYGDKRKAESMLAEGWPAKKEGVKRVDENGNKIEPSRPHLDKIERTGEDVRGGRNIGANDFIKEFGFRGVEFGNYVAQDERQRTLNLAFEALHDLAGVLNLPIKALSLNGTMGLAFGARGGGRNTAHYEPGKLVINMTKMSGAGALAHEWGHALDHYFGELNQPDAYQGKPRGVSGWYKKGSQRLTNLRPDMRAAFDGVMEALFHRDKTKAEAVRELELEIEQYAMMLDHDKERAKTETDPAKQNHWRKYAAQLEAWLLPRRARLAKLTGEQTAGGYGKVESSYYKNAKALSGKSGSSGYWARPTEMFARAFESYVFDKLGADGRASQYLVQGVEADRHASDRYRGNPYPVGPERERIDAAFDRLIDTIKTKETDQGVAMFSRRKMPLTGNPLTNLWKMLAQDDAAFQQPTSNEEDMRAIAADIDPDIRVEDDTWLNRDKSVKKLWKIIMPDHRTAEVTESVHGRIVLNASRLKAGESRGSALYNIVATYAHNNKKVFIGDPLGLSNDALYRRLENMISTTLRFGTTRHIEPHSDQISKLKLDWKQGDDEHNLNQMLLASYNSVVKHVPGIKDVVYNFKTGRFEKSGQPFTDSDFAGLARSARSPGSGRNQGNDAQARASLGSVPVARSGDIASNGSRGTTFPVGRTTLKRAALTNTVVRGTGEKESGPGSLLEPIVQQLHKGVAGTPLQKLLYRRSSEARPGAGMSVPDVSAIVDPIRAKWKNAPRVEIHESAESIPADLRAAIDTQAATEAKSRGISQDQARDDIMSGMEGVYWRGAVHIVADKMHNADHVQFTLLHEALGHAGMRGLFGRELSPLLNRIYLTNADVRSEAAKLMDRFGYDKTRATEEVLADMAGRGETQAWWQQVVAFVRDWLRRHGFTLKVSNADVRKIVADAGKFVTEGDAAHVYPASLAPQYNRAAPTFYSQMQSVLADKLPATGPAQAMRQAVKAYADKGLFKKEEYEWSGVDDWLKEQQGRVTRDQVLEFMRGNNIQVHESMLGDADKADLSKKISDIGVRYDAAEGDVANARHAAFGPRWAKEAFLGRETLALLPSWAENVANGFNTTENMNKINALHLSAERKNLVLEYGKALARSHDLLKAKLDLQNRLKNGDTKFSNYQLHGGDNYRELLLTLPPAHQSKLEQYHAAIKADAQKEVLDRLSDEVAKVRVPTFNSTHFDQPNILAHVRFNERTDAEGKHVLFIEEVQSDWHQKGRKEGYKGDPLQAQKFFGITNEAWSSLTQAQKNAYVEDMNNRSAGQVGVPNAPFKTTWPMLAMKRMIRYAAENGFDKIAWTTGEQQADRYDLSKHIERVHAEMLPSRKAVQLTVIGKDGKAVMKDERIDVDRLPDYVGKELAEKIVKDGGGNYTGLDLKIGGEGMKAFYDKMLPSEINKYVKKWGASVGSTKIDFGGNAKTVHSLSITPAMRDSVMQGQPMFARNENSLQTDTPEFRKWFGDSKVVDKHGKPLVVYHGTKADISAFKQSTGGEYGRGIYFTDDPSTAAKFAAYAEGDTGNNVVPAYLSIKSPYIAATRDEVRALGPTKLMRMGYDGIIAQSPLGKRQYIAFDPAQIKSAIGNRGTFDPNDPDIRFSRSKTNQESNQLFDGFDLPSETTMDMLRRRFQDKFIRVRRAQEAAGKVTDATNPYLAEELYYGKTESDLDAFSKSHVDPLVDEIRKHKLSLDQVDQYLYARHAPERNARIAEINPKFRESGVPGSGMSDAESAAVIDGFRKQGLLPGLEAVAERVDAINNDRLQRLVKHGLESLDTVALWGNYKHYVPLKGVPDESGNVPRTGRGFDIRGKESKTAFGRKSMAKDLLANTIAQAEASIVRAQKNEVGKTFLQFVESNPNNDLWEVNRVEIKPALDKNTGEVVYRPDRFHKYADNVMSVKVDGKETLVTIHDDLLARAMKNLGAENSGSIVNALATVNRYLAMVNTSLNPEFVISNFARDIQTALGNIVGEDIGGKSPVAIASQVVKSIPGAMRGTYAALREKTHKNADVAEWSNIYNDYKAAGGKVGFFGLNDIETKRKKLHRAIKLASGGVAAKGEEAIKAVGSFIMDVNGAVENATRVAAYKAAIDAGVSKPQAASFAKNLTVNFNRKGELGTAMNALYLFYNAGVQGSARLLHALKSPRVQKLALGIAVGAFALAELNRLIAGEDDDGENRYDKLARLSPNLIERNIVIMRPNGGYYMIPLPYGYNVFHVIGSGLSHIVHQKDKMRVATRALLASIDAFNPIGSSGSLLQLVSPTITDPLVQLSTNENFFGGPIAPEQRGFGPKKPNSQMYWNSVSPISKSVAQELNSLTGGSSVRPGLIDVSPESIDYGITQLTGGAGAFWNRAINAVGSAAAGQPVPVGKIPFVRRFAGEAPEWQDSRIFYDRLNEVKLAHDDLEATRKQEGFAAARAKRDEYKPILKLYNYAMATEGLIAGDRKELHKIELSGLAAGEKERRIGLIKDRMQKRMALFDKRYNEATAQ